MTVCYSMSPFLSLSIFLLPVCLNVCLSVLSLSHDIFPLYVSFMSVDLSVLLCLSVCLSLFLSLSIFLTLIFVIDSSYFASVSFLFYCTRVIVSTSFLATSVPHLFLSVSRYFSLSVTLCLFLYFLFMHLILSPFVYQLSVCLYC